LCDDPSDLEKIEAKLNHLEIDFVLYCPCLPYNHPYDVIDNFLDQVENERKGLLVTLLCMIGNLRSDHVIYLPCSQNPLNEPGNIHQLSLGDAFVLDRNFLVDTDLHTRSLSCLNCGRNVDDTIGVDKPICSCCEQLWTSTLKSSERATDNLAEYLGAYAKAEAVTARVEAGVKHTPLKVHAQGPATAAETGFSWDYAGANVGASLGEARAGPFAARAGVKFGAGVRNGVPEVDLGPVTVPCSIM